MTTIKTKSYKILQMIIFTKINASYYKVILNDYSVK
jgi:hypothetical protein